MFLFHGLNFCNMPCERNNQLKSIIKLSYQPYGQRRLKVWKCMLCELNIKKGFRAPLNEESRKKDFTDKITDFLRKFLLISRMLTFL